MSPLATSRLPIGAELQRDGGIRFRVWAPTPKNIALVIESGEGRSTDIPLQHDGHGYYSATLPGAGAGCRYWYRLDGILHPDPASRYQPDGPFGPSEVVDPGAYVWGDTGWSGCRLEGQVLYELHVGTFTREGTWRAAAERLPDLVRTGISVIELMPIAEFPGRFGWGYDGVFPYAPTRLYGCPDDCRAFVDRAHQLGLGVILDVVYNHLGPKGEVFRTYAKEYFTSRYENEWGEPLNFDGEGSEAVREYFISNAGYWIDEYHLDGLRLDATQSIHDSSEVHVIAAIGARAREAAGGRPIIIVSENEPQDVRMVRPVAEGGYGLDALWNDDFHHSAAVALTGRREAYYSDHHGAPQELISAAKYGYLFQGQRYAWQNQPRGTRTSGIPPAAFVTFIENHDQLANSGDGSRIRMRTSPGLYRTMTALMLLLPGTPMLFQGQEFGASTPFRYFADHDGALAAQVRKGRAEFLSQMPSLASAQMRERLAPPDALETFERCKLRWDEYEAHATHRRLHESVIALRRRDEAFRVQRSGVVDGAVLAPEAFVLRFTLPEPADERLVLVNLGVDITAASFPEPLVSPPAGYDWALEWSSEDPEYGGCGTPDIAGDWGWRVPGRALVVLHPIERAPEQARGDRSV